MLNVEDFLRIDEDDSYAELVDGETVPCPDNGWVHSMVRNTLSRLLNRSGIEGYRFSCWVRPSFRLGDFTALMPDVALFSFERLRNRTDNLPTEGAPEIAIEVAINDKPWMLQRKIGAYLSNGAQAVCCVYPDLRTVVVYTAREWRELTETETLEFPALLPGVKIPISSIFEGI